MYVAVPINFCVSAVKLMDTSEHLKTCLWLNLKVLSFFLMFKFCYCIAVQKPGLQMNKDITSLLSDRNVVHAIAVGHSVGGVQCPQD